MARKQPADLRAAAQALAPVRQQPQPAAAPEPVQTPEERQASRERIWRMLENCKQRMRATPRPKPIDEWRRILSNPYACFHAKELAREAIEELEGNFKEVERIAVEAEIQENARRIAKRIGAEQQQPENPDERAGTTA